MAVWMFCLGLFIGFNLGIVLMAILYAARDN